MHFWRKIFLLKKFHSSLNQMKVGQYSIAKSHQMKNFIYTLCVLIALGTSMYTQAQIGGNVLMDQKSTAGNYNYMNQGIINERVNIPINSPNGNYISIKADVLMNLKATSYTAIFAITQNGKDVYQTDSLMRARLNQIMFGLGRLGIAEENIHIDAVSLVPTYAYKLEEKKFSKHSVEVPTGFELKKNIHILITDHAILDHVISELAFAEVYDMVKVEYNIDGMQTYYDQLRKAAMSVIDTKKATYSDFGFHLIIQTLGDGFNVTYPIERYKSYTAFNTGTTIQAVTEAKAMQNNTLNVYANNVLVHNETKRLSEPQQQFVVQTAEKNKTIFYDRIAYNQFDKVINADTEEPCIQLTYSLQVNFSMMTEESWKLQEEMKKQNELAMKAPDKKKKMRRNA
jgi:hypothetical protein